MQYSFEIVRKVYLRQFIIELNDIPINTHQDDYESFIKLFKKSKDYTKVNALLKTIQILDNTNLTQEDVQTSLATLHSSHKDKETKRLIANLSVVLQGKLPKLFDSFNLNSKKKYLRNTFWKLRASLPELLNKNIRTLYDISTSEYEDALNKVNFEEIFLNFEKRVLPLREKISNRKDYHFPLYDTMNCTYLTHDEIVHDSTHGNYLKYFYLALFQSAKYILLSKILVQKNRRISLIKTNSQKQKLSHNKNIAYDVSEMLTLKNLGKNRTNVYMVNLAHYLQLTPFEAFDFSNYYLGKGNSINIKKNVDLEIMENSFYAIHKSLFPNYILYKHSIFDSREEDTFVLKKASNILLTMLLEGAQKEYRALTQEEKQRKHDAYGIIIHAIQQKIMNELQNPKITSPQDNKALGKMIEKCCATMYNDVEEVIQKFPEAYHYLSARLNLELQIVYRITFRFIKESVTNQDISSK